MKNKELNILISERQVFLDKEHHYYDQFTDDELGSDDLKEYDQDPKCEELRLKILDFIVNNHQQLTIESIFEGLTSIGDCPNLLYDDDGNFAVGNSGVQSFNLETNKKSSDRLDFKGIWFLKKKDWKPTIREAIQAYFERD